VAGPDRDRRDDGRPEQARPRDRTGRPLPYGTTDVPLIEEHDPATVEEALEMGRRLWDEERYFEAHECLESVWHASPEDDQEFWQGVIQIAVAGVHIQRANPTGALTLLDRAHGRLEPYPDEHRGIDVEAARRTCRRLTEQIQRDGIDAAGSPGPFPSAAGGPWFTPDPAALEPPNEPTPIPDEPVWVTAGRPRRPQQRGNGQ
jgi:uncharacterized protein